MDEGCSIYSTKSMDCRYEGHLRTIHDIYYQVANTPIDYKVLSQNELDLIGRSRVNLFPWRGQFSPELIENLLRKYAAADSVVFDPFAGSGTTLFEAARNSLACFGTEINPAAVEMARTIKFANLDYNEREEHIKNAKRILEDNLPLLSRGLLQYAQDTPKIASEDELFQKMLSESSNNVYTHNLIINTLMKHYTSKQKKSNNIFYAFKKHIEIIRSLPLNTKQCEIYQCDARKTPLKDEMIDLIITSPPYINVFNYHQQYREVLELDGWKLLEVAKCEIGSNRKNRGNRFLTAIQYSIDMLLALSEMKRILKPDGRIIIVIGRESNVRKVSLENYKIISALAMGGAGLKLERRHERKFINRFGKKIYEDILVFSVNGICKDGSSDYARSVAVHLLEDALTRADESVRRDIELAIIKANEVLPSPQYDYKITKVDTHELDTAQR